MTIKKVSAKKKRDALFWSGLVTEALAKAKTTNKKQTITVGSLKTAFMLQDSLTNLALGGQDEAWYVEVKLETLH
jgi:hypothetical protein|tara:strand:- start:919 stop:1143 length:225 start_codon:yes stop_codon:yes gene_type:complete